MYIHVNTKCKHTRVLPKEIRDYLSKRYKLWSHFDFAFIHDMVIVFAPSSKRIFWIFLKVGRSVYLAHSPVKASNVLKRARVQTIKPTAYLGDIKDLSEMSPWTRLQFDMMLEEEARNQEESWRSFDQSVITEK